MQGRDFVGIATAIAFALIVAGIVLAPWPRTLALSSASLVLASLLLLAALLANLATAAIQRGTS